MFAPRLTLAFLGSFAALWLSSVHWIGALGPIMALVGVPAYYITGLLAVILPTTISFLAPVIVAAVLLWIDWKVGAMGMVGRRDSP